MDLQLAQLKSAMASFLHRTRSTFFQNLKILKTLTPRLHSNPSSSTHSNHFPPFSDSINNSISNSNTRFQSIHPQIRFSSTSPENPQSDLQHQEITGPTVEQDISPLAKEMREVLQSLRRSVYDLSSSLALLGFVHLGLGVWIAYSVKPPNEVSVQGFAGFAFPFSMAFLLRRSVKPMEFFQKIEQQRRLQILTLALQISKNLRVLFVRMRVVCFCCVVGISAGSLAVVWVR